MKFDPNWNTDAVYHHLASQTYLKGWKHGDSSVYYIEKNDVNINGNWTRNTRRLAGIENFFSRRAGAFSANLTDCQKFFKPLKNYTVKYKDKTLINPIELNKHFNLYDEWKIYDSSFNEISISDKKRLKNIIKDIHIRDIEVGWSRLHENNWPSIRNDILNVISSNPKATRIPSVRKDEFINFMVSLEWRTEPTHPVLEESFKSVEAMPLVKSAMNEIIPEDERLYPFLETPKEEFLHNMLLKYYHKFLNDNGPIYQEAQEIIQKMNIELLIAENSSEFITSDNPVCRFINGDGLLEYIFPITPQVACAVRKGNPYDGNNYSVVYLKKEEVFKYNQKLKDNCFNGYILHRPSLTYYFK
ncbi:TPA: DUF4238 domain-containing protein [Bacillus cereus]|uniref:DUF4238 domain-containing protein n=1 Tax=Bacillus cereus group TaxID=86661 RepID=UPI00202CC0E9|nr:DUF4238 domain-containing protein [Bacillus paranthracis]HDR4391983.1 DUF4238 domain-containing protein [Bacillus cereus]HEI9576185.1 DUF4238 domain-containing protein [Bacillus cereus]HEI9581514.1 DUF4238 domain-containing protein [Bacillus cereus]HEP1849304.1 DUF4238 domain-containing protein [Bacillus cereus]